MSEDENKLVVQPDIETVHDSMLTNARVLIPLFSSLFAIISGIGWFGCLGAAGGAWLLLRATRAQGHRAQRVDRFLKDVKGHVDRIDSDKIDEDYIQSPEYLDFLNEVFEAAASARTDQQRRMIVNLLVETIVGKTTNHTNDSYFAQTLTSLDEKQARLVNFMWVKYCAYPIDMIEYDTRHDIDYEVDELEIEQRLKDDWESIVLDFFDAEERLTDGQTIRRDYEHSLLLAPLIQSLQSLGMIQKGMSEYYQLTPYATSLMSFVDRKTYDFETKEMREAEIDEDLVTFIDMIR